MKNLWRKLTGNKVRQRVLVNTGGERAFRGILWEDGNRYLVLKSCTLVGNRQEEISVDGEVLVPRGRVEFIQIIGA